MILFFTETLFFIGASLFLYIAHISRLAAPAVAAALEPKPASPVVYSWGYRLSARIALGAGVVLPLATFVMVWPWTGPAAAAALAPYMIGLLVQLGFEKIIHSNDSPVWPLVPVTFQVGFLPNRESFVLCSEYFVMAYRPSPRGRGSWRYVAGEFCLADCRAVVLSLILFPGCYQGGLPVSV